MIGRRVKRVGFFIASKGVFRHFDPQEKPMFITEYIPDVRFFISQTYPPYYDCCGW